MGQARNSNLQGTRFPGFWVAGSFPCGQTLRQSAQQNAAQSPQNVDIARAQSRNGQQVVLSAEWQEGVSEGHSQNKYE